MPVSIQYAGFQVQPYGREYSYYVLNPPAASRHFLLTISHQAFAERQILYQDAADLCYQKLQRDLVKAPSMQRLRASNRLVAE